MKQITDHTPLPWECKPHIMDDSTTCNCTTWCESGYAGGVLSVEKSNGIPLVSEGGNDAPPFEEAKANAIFVDRAIHSFYPMLEALQKISKPALGGKQQQYIAQQVLSEIGLGSA